MSQQDLSKSVCFDYSHNNILTIESPSFADFTEFLFGSSFRLGKVQAGFSSLDKVRQYRMIIMGGPRDAVIDVEEIKALVEYVKEGGSLFIIGDEGGDYGGKINLNELTQNFGFQFNSDTLSDSTQFQGNQNRVIITDFDPHPVTENIDQILQASGCSISVHKLAEADENIKVTPLAWTSLNAYHKRWTGQEWIEDEDAPKSVVVVAVDYYKGRVVAMCSVSMFSSLSSAYGYFALNNEGLITNIFHWLLEPQKKGTGSRNETLLNIGINTSLLAWMEKLIQTKKWGDIGDIVNFSLKYFKDNYDHVIHYAEERRAQLKKEREIQLKELEKIEDEKERQRQAAVIGLEDKLLQLPEDTIDVSKDFEDIMASLRDVTGGAIGKELDERFHPHQPKESKLKQEITNPATESTINAEQTKPNESNLPGNEKIKLEKDIDHLLKDLKSFDAFSKEVEQLKKEEVERISKKKKKSSDKL